MCTITENHPFNHSIHSGAEEIKIDMLIKRFTLDRKQPSDRCYKLKVLYSIIFNLLKMNNPSLHIKSFFSRGSISFMSKRIHSFIMLQFYRQWWSFIHLWANVLTSFWFPLNLENIWRISAEASIYKKWESTLTIDGNLLNLSLLHECPYWHSVINNFYNSKCCFMSSHYVC